MPHSSRTCRCRTPISAPDVRRTQARMNCPSRRGEQMNPDEISAVNDGRPIVFRNATVLTMDGAGIIAGGDVLVVGDSIAGVGPALIAPEGAIEIDAAGGILMPGMVDTHRHMWQTALRGLGADWTLTQYFVFYYLSWGKIFRPEDIHAGNLLSAIEAVDAGVTTTLDWSTVCRPSTTVRPPRTRCWPRPAGSSWRTVICSARRGNGPTATSFAPS